jgi:predicted Abi (CAAX) family protease
VLGREGGVATRTTARRKVATYLTINRTANQLLVTILSIISLQTYKHTTMVSIVTVKHKSVVGTNSQTYKEQPMNINQATDSSRLCLIVVTCTIPAMCEEKVSLKMTLPVSKDRTSTFPLDQPVISSGTPSLFKSKLCRHIGWCFDWT